MSGETRQAFLFPPRSADRPPPVGQMSQLGGLYARELLHTFRNPWILVITVVQPFMWLAFFGSSFAAAPPNFVESFFGTSSYIAYLLPGVLSTSMLTIGMFGSMSTIQDKRFGFMKRILLTPTKRATVYLSKALGAATRGVVQIPVMVAAALAFGVHLDGSPLLWAGWVLGLVLLGLGFASVFLAVTATSTDWQTPGVISNFITMPLMFASGALFPAANFPVWMQWIARFNPVSYSALFGRGILVHGVANWLYLGYLAVFAGGAMLVGTLIAGRYLRVE